MKRIYKCSGVAGSCAPCMRYPQDFDQTETVRHTKTEGAHTRTTLSEGVGLATARVQQLCRLPGLRNGTQ